EHLAQIDGVVLDAELFADAGGVDHAGVAATASRLDQPAGDTDDIVAGLEHEQRCRAAVDSAAHRYRHPGFAGNNRSNRALPGQLAVSGHRRLRRLLFGVYMYVFGRHDRYHFRWFSRVSIISRPSRRLDTEALQALPGLLDVQPLRGLRQVDLVFAYR